MTETQGSKLNTQGSKPRPPIVVIMGHVDHGKTTLLDYIRKTNVVSREAGGITQSIGAYEITHPSAGSGQAKKITFIDTPGHEAFSKMRARGASVADLAILVVAADDGVKPQTKEVIEVLKETKTTFVVAINKIDKNNADIEGTKQALMQNEVFLEGAGGNVSWQEISAKTGEGIDELLDLILLAAELEGLTYDPMAPAEGVVIESKMDTRRGLTVAGVLRNGILKSGEEIKTASAEGKVKVLEDFLGKRVNELAPSSPVLIVGFESLPQVGEVFCAGKTCLINEEVGGAAEGAKIEVKEKTQKEKDSTLSIFLKADVAGSLEAIAEILKTNPDIKIISESIGEITDGDVKNAGPLGALIVGFKTKIGKSAENLIRAQGTEVVISEIIYELLNVLEEKVQALKQPPPLGEFTALAIFSQKNKKQIIGGKVDSGILKTNSPVKIFRGEGDEEIGKGRITGLRKGKQEANQILAGEECGVQLELDFVLQIGDRLVIEG